MTRPTNTQFSLAVHLLTLLSGAEPGQLLDSTELAISPATNPAHVRRVLGHLRTARLVVSHLGTHGGWALARPPAEINLAEVWHAVNGEEPLWAMHTPDIDCPIGRRVEENLQALDGRALALLLDELAGHTIADLKADVDRSMAGVKPPRPPLHAATTLSRCHSR